MLTDQLAGLLDSSFAAVFGPVQKTKYLNSQANISPGKSKPNEAAPNEIPKTQPGVIKTRPVTKSQVTPQAKTPVRPPARSAQVDPVAKNLSDLRKTAAFLANGKKLFDGGASNYLLDATMAMNLLEAMGIPVSKDVKLSVAACQVIAAGGAASSAIEAGKSFGAVAAPTASAIGAAVHLMQAAGFIELDREQMATVDIGLDIVMVVAADGLNVVADLKLIYDVAMYTTNEQSKFETMARQDAQAGLRDLTAPIIEGQKSWLLYNFKRLAEGKIGMFDFASSVAYQSANFMGNVFPEISVFFPPIAQASFHYTANKSNWMGRAASSTQEMSIDIDRYGGPKMFFDNWAAAFLDPIIEPYNRVLAEDLNGGDIRNKIGLNSLAIMSLLPGGLDRIEENFDVRTYLKKWQLTPADFPWDDCIIAELMADQSKWFANPVEAKIESPLTFNGVEYFSPLIISQNERLHLRYLLRKQAFEANHNGDIDTLLTDPSANELIKQWGVLQDFGPSTIQTVNGYLTRTASGVKTFLPLPEYDGSLLSAQVRMRNQLMNGSWRDIKNYIGVLSVIKFLTNKNVYTQSVGPIATKFGTIPNFDQSSRPINYFREKYPQLDMDIERMESEYSKILQKSTYRRLNKFAMQNIADMLNVPIEKLRFENKNDLQPDQAGIFRGI